MPDDNARNTRTEPHPFPLLVNLGAGLRLAFFRAVRADEFHFSHRQIAALVGLQLAMLLVYDYVTAGTAPVFDAYAVTAVGTEYLLFLFSVYLICAWLAGPASFTRLLLMLVAVTPVTTGVYLFAVEVLKLSAGLTDAAHWILWWAAVAWFLAIVFRALDLLAAIDRARALAGTLLYALLNTLPALLLPSAQFWYDDGPLTYSEHERVNVEDTYYRQAALVDAIELRASTPGQIDLYFLGVAPYALQDVFKSEVRYAQRLFDKRFGTDGRSAVLINHVSTLQDTALATGHNLDRLLQRMAAQMDVQEDILFLYLTSHGSRNARLSASFYPLEPNDIDAEALRGMLDRAGIKWRVIVVSACFSGSFIETLASEHTLIATAAHAQRQSFGCANGRDFTYFGEAFLRDALPHAASFLDAFRQAETAIATRERAEGLQPSQPQLQVGSAMEARLARLAATR